VSEPDFFADLDGEVLGRVGVPISMTLRALVQMRPLLVNYEEGASAQLVDAAFLQALIIALADIIVHDHTDEEQDAELIDGFTAKLRETVAIARLMS
jgi:hypothetical protein